MNRFFRWLRQLFMGNDDKKYVYRLFNRLLLKYGVARDGSNFYARGRLCTSEAQYEGHVNNVIKPLFKNMLDEGILHLEEIEKASRADADKYKNKAAKAEEKLDETDENGKLFKYQQEIDRIQSIPDDTKDIDFPEIRMEQTSKSIFHIYQKNAEKILESGEQDVLPELNKQKQMALSAGQAFQSFKDQLISYSAFRHSKHLPSRPGQYKNFYSLCLLITCGEIGLTSPIVKRLVDVRIFGISVIDKPLELVLSMLYATIVSLSLAIVLKYLADALLYRNYRRMFFFWTTCLIIFMGMSILFSLGSGSGNKESSSFLGFTITHKAFVLSFFSVLLALANGFLFREASYLKDMYYRQKQNTVKDVQNKQEKYFRHWKNKADTSWQKAKEQDNKVQMNQQLIEDFKSLVGNQESICIHRYREGFEHTLREEVRKNNELLLTMTNLLKKEL